MSNLDPALALAAGGWQVFPCWPNGDRAKSPMTRNGFKDAARDPDQVRSWWQQRPGALIGAVVPAHMIVLDIDPHNGGSLDTLEAALGPLQPTLTVWSGRGDGGRHLYYFRPPGDLTSTGLPTGVDLRIGGRHYMVMPPSRHPLTGTPYQWEEREVTHLTDVAASKLRRSTRPRASRRVSPDAARNGLVAFVAGAPEGERNSRLFWAACRAVEKGDHGLLAPLKTAALHTGLTEAEVDRTIRSASHESRTA